MDFSALVVPVPSVDWLVLDRCPDPGGPTLPAHVTLLSPFVPPADLTDGDVSELRDLFADVVSFSFVFDDVATFPDGTVYLSPEPSAPFRQLTHALHRAFPEYPPYGGRFDTVVPHVTVPVLDGEDDEDVARLLADRAERFGTVRGFAQEAQLVVMGAQDARVLHEFPFGVAAA